jgi:hypothetical protein
MTEDTLGLNNVITIDNERIKSHLDRVVRGSVVETLNALLDAEADRHQPHPASALFHDGAYNHCRADCEHSKPRTV